MTYAPRAYFNTGKIVGCFNEKEHGAFFEYADNDEGDTYAPRSRWPHIVFVNDVHGSGFRYAKVLKTVAYVVVDEADDGGDVIEKWVIKGHRQYSTYTGG